MSNTLADLDRLADPYEADGTTRKPDQGLVHVRLQLGGRAIVGVVSPSRYGGGQYPRIAFRKGHRQEYTPIFQRHLDEDQLQIKVGSRYVAAREVLDPT